MTLKECYDKYRYRPLTEGERWWPALRLSIPNDVEITDIADTTKSMRQIVFGAKS